MSGKGDFSRSTFNRARHYTSVRMQQGRVMLDAEGNEQADIQNYLRHTVSRDLIGRSGAPRDDGGFRIGAITDDVLISAGRFYVDGIMCECEGTSSPVLAATGSPITTLTLQNWGPELVNGAWVEVEGLHTNGSPLTTFAQITGSNPNALTIAVTPLPSWSAVYFVRSTVRYTAQPDFPSPPFITAGKVPGGEYLAYIQVWNRHITPLEDPLIRETALGIPDTTVREKTIWQVVLKQPVQDCNTFAPSSVRGGMAARTVPPVAASNPCEIPRSAGYRRLENQLYRVEIHNGGGFPGATFKWSRDNGSIVFPIDSLVANDQVRLRSYGLDDRLSLHVNDWVEILDDNQDLALVPGTFVQVLGPPQSADPVVKLSAAVNAAVNFARNPRLRLWARPDAAKAVRTLNEGANADGYVALEDGIEVKFSPAGQYNTGDYWLIPARTAISQETGSIEWPVSGPNPLTLPPLGIVRHFAPLAEIRSTGVEDCRPIFNPASAPDLDYAGGDGQEVMPNVTNPTQTVKLPLDLLASVSNGNAIAGASVEFSIVAPGNGTVGGGAVKTLVVKTDAGGIARCSWSVDSVSLTQTVQARLIATDLPGFVPGQPPILYNAHLSTAANVAYTPGACTYLNDVITVQAALDKLCKRSDGVCSIVISPGDDINARLLEVATELDLEICFRTGLFNAPSPVLIAGKRSVKMVGTGDGSHVIAGQAIAFRFDKCNSVLVRDLWVDGSMGGEQNDIPAGVLHFNSCSEVSLDQLRVTCASKTGETAPIRACINIRSGQDIDVRHCTLSAAVAMIGLHLDLPARAVVMENRINAVQASLDVIILYGKGEVARAMAVQGLIAQPAVRPAAPLTPVTGLPPVAGVEIGLPPTVGQPPVLGPPPPPPVGVPVAVGTPAVTPSLKIGTQGVSLTFDPGVVADLQTLINEVDTRTVTTPDAANKLLLDVIDRSIRDATIRQRVPRLDQMYINWGFFASRAGLGIVARGAAIGSLTIRDNEVRQVGVGIRAGLGDQSNFNIFARTAAGGPAVGAPVQVEHVVRAAISGNEILALATWSDSEPRCIGIDVASCDNLHIFGNRVDADTSRNANVAINTFGNLGSFAMIRDNELRNFYLGINALILNPGFIPHQWRVVNNIAIAVAVPPYIVAPMLL
ncbi:MAG: hypothetical protein JWO56_1820, partial [Acidobacteria bacterium]|nr:hypothetical protein [Acidobacteriota bacterium]